MEEKRIKLYTLSTCSHCKAAKRFLRDHGFDYDFTDVDLLSGQERTDMIAEMGRYNPNITFPTIVIGEQVIVGNDEERIREVLSITS
jgi:glutaredoxin-like protein NrdH